MQAVYTAILTHDSAAGVVHVSVPDLPSCITFGTDMRDALISVDDALNLCLVSMENHGDPIPLPTPPDQVAIPNGSISTLVNIDTTAYRRLTEQRAVKKTISIPQWMAVQVDKLNLNLSRITQEALSAMLPSPQTQQ